MGLMTQEEHYFFDILRILKHHKPKGFLLENVEGLLTHDKGRTHKIILSSLKNLGYNVSYEVLDSKDFSIAQSRKRIYIVGSFSEVNLSFDSFENVFFKDIQEHNQPIINSNFTNKILKHYSLEELQGKSIKDKRGGKNNIHSWDFGLKGDITPQQKEFMNILFKERRKKHWSTEIGIDYMDGVPLTFKQILTFYNIEETLIKELVSKGYLKYEFPKKKVSNRRVYDDTKPKGYNIVTGRLSFEFPKIIHPNGLFPTVTATDALKNAVIDNGLRKPTVKEGLRLFGYGDNYNFGELSENKIWDLLGNTVVVNVVSEVSKCLLEGLSDET